MRKAFSVGGMGGLTSPASHFVTPQDVKSVAMDVLRHRVSVTYEAEAESVTSKDVVEKILNTLPVP